MCIFCCGVYLSIDFVAPSQSLAVKIVQRVVPDANHKIVPDELHRALYLAFRLTTVRPAQHRFESIEPGKVLKLPFRVLSSCFSSRLMTTCFMLSYRISSG
jgi:hypothetical protein